MTAPAETIPAVFLVVFIVAFGVALLRGADRVAPLEHIDNDDDNAKP